MNHSDPDFWEHKTHHRFINIPMFITFPELQVLWTLESTVWDGTWVPQTALLQVLLQQSSALSTARAQQTHWDEGLLWHPAFYTYSIPASQTSPLLMTKALLYSCSAAAVIHTMENVNLRAAWAILALAISCWSQGKFCLAGLKTCWPHPPVPAHHQHFHRAPAISSLWKGLGNFVVSTSNSIFCLVDGNHCATTPYLWKPRGVHLFSIPGLSSKVVTFLSLCSYAAKFKKTHAAIKQPWRKAPHGVTLLNQSQRLTWAHPWIYRQSKQSWALLSRRMACPELPAVPGEAAAPAAPQSWMLPQHRSRAAGQPLLPWQGRPCQTQPLK